jgi:hypothetical protein
MNEQDQQDALLWMLSEEEYLTKNEEKNDKRNSTGQF